LQLARSESTLTCRICEAPELQTYTLLQGSGNDADSVELQVPKGSKYEKTILMECDF